MGILHYLDIVIGFAFVMTVMATLAAVSVQLVLNLLQTRARKTRQTLAALLKDLAGENEAKALALAHWLMTEGRVGGDHLFAGAGARLFRLRMPGAGSDSAAPADALCREEIILQLLRKAIQEPAGALAAKVTELTGKKAAALLGEIEQRVLAHEAASPDLPAQVWRTRAIQETGAGPLAARLFLWFDAAMDRVDDRVNTDARIWSALAGLLLCSFMNLDAFTLAGRLSHDNAYRQAMVEKARVYQQIDASKARSVLEEIDTAQTLLEWPRPEQRWTWSLGVLLSGILVSLGAPFWMSLANRATGLRSEIQARSAVQRAYRDQDQRIPPPPAIPTPAAAPPGPAPAPGDNSR